MVNNMCSSRRGVVNVMMASTILSTYGSEMGRKSVWDLPFSPQLSFLFLYPRSLCRPHSTLFRVTSAPDYFEVVDDFPKTPNNNCVAAHKTDVDHDGLDDLIVCQGGSSLIFHQLPDGSFEVFEGTDENGKAEAFEGWKSVRVGHVLGSDCPDLVVGGVTKEGRHFVRVYKGKRGRPYFNFNEPAYELYVDHSIPDLELIDVDDDGRLDIYVIQNDISDPSSYCGKFFMQLGGQTCTWKISV